MTENNQPVQQNNTGFNPSEFSFGGFGSSTSNNLKSFSNVSSSNTGLFSVTNQQNSESNNMFGSANTAFGGVGATFGELQTQNVPLFGGMA